jgi:hypothetical protein
LELGHVHQAFISFTQAKDLLEKMTTNVQQYQEKLISIISKIGKLGDVNNIGVTESMSNEATVSFIERQVIKKRETVPELNRNRNARLPAASNLIELTDFADRARCLKTFK